MYPHSPNSKLFSFPLKVLENMLGAYIVYVNWGVGIFNFTMAPSNPHSYVTKNSGLYYTVHRHTMKNKQRKYRYKREKKIADSSSKYLNIKDRKVHKYLEWNKYSVNVIVTAINTVGHLSTELSHMIQILFAKTNMIVFLNFLFRLAVNSF